MLIGEIFIEHLVELLMGLIISFNIGAYSLLWRKIEDIEDETGKNSETLNMIIHRIFGIDEDPTDKGHIPETEKRLENFSEKLEEISQKQDEARQERKREHREVDSKISSIIRVLEEEEDIDVHKRDFK